MTNYISVVMPTVGAAEAKMEAYSLPTGAVVSTNAIKIHRTNGKAALLVETHGSGNDVDITYEVSNNGGTWFTPITTSK